MSPRTEAPFSCGEGYSGALGEAEQTVNYTYSNDGKSGWNYLLTGIGNESITYDEIGNPTQYLGATLSWRGRELVSYEKGSKNISYSYDVDGMRYKKVVKTGNAVTATYNYVYSDEKLVLLVYTENGVANSARFVYDVSGEVRGFILNDSAVYMYLKNAQGDVTSVVDKSGAVVIRYTYNAWGETEFTVPSGTAPADTALISKVSPFTYRGYCYDFDIGLYYLQSRYYDPKLCRFINADSTDYLGATGTPFSYNLFAYCENDPVNCVDITGCYKNTGISIYRGFPNWKDPFEGDDDFFYDPTIIATAQDYNNWKTWGRLQRFASVLYPEGAAFYEYYRSNKGGILFYDYTKAYKQDISIRVNVSNYLKILKSATPLFVDRYDEWFVVSTSLKLINSVSMNWRLALGGHYFGIITTIKYISQSETYVMNYYVIAIDRYNFDGNNKNFFGIKDSYNGRFVTLGWAKFFTSIGVMVGSKSWKK